MRGEQVRELAAALRRKHEQARAASAPRASLHTETILHNTETSET